MHGFEETKMNRAPFSSAHAFLIELGFDFDSYEADWHDDGDGENGPHLSGGPAYDEYCDGYICLYFEEGGKFAGEAGCDPPEAFS